MPQFKVAAIQMNSQPDLDMNMGNVQRLLKEASEHGANFIGLPENFAFLGDEPERLKQVKRISIAVESRLSEWAKEFGVWILAGGYPVPADENKMYNRAALISPGGELTAFYDKIHLFDITLSDRDSYRESELVKAGELNPVVYQIPGFMHVGLSICYDLRFPELYRSLSDRQAQLLCVPSAFTKPTGEAHWEVLLRARAIENTAYLLAPAQTGLHGEKRETYGHSMIIDPWGSILAEAGSEPGIIYAEIDPDKIERIRKKLPSLRHRRL